MPNTTFTQSVAVILGVAFVFAVQITTVSNYSSYLLAFLIIFTAIYISIKKRSKTASEIFTGSPIEIFAIVSIILLTIVLTNGLASPLFFFLYFVLFLLAFMAESATIWVLLGMIILFFIPEATNTPTTDTFIKIGSLLLIAPIAYFVGRELERRQLLSRSIQSKTDEIIQEAQILKEEGSGEENEVIDEIIEEAESLKKDAEN